MADYIRRQLALLDAPPPSVQPDTTPARGGIVGLLGRIGTALAGGSVTDVLSPAQRERAGIRALGDFGTSLMAGSGYYPGKPMFGGLAQGFQGAERSEAGSEQQAASYLGAQQNWQMEQQKLQLERIKEALPLLQMQTGANLPNPLLTNAPVVPGTATGAGKPGGGGVALTPFIAKNLPAGVSPAEDQMVRTVWGEARGEPLAGQQGVAAVIKNRMAAGNQDAQGVIFKPGAFSSWADKQRPDMEALSPSDPKYQDILNKAVRPVLAGDVPDPTGGATNFYAPTGMPQGGPSWAAGQQPSAVIGGHQFYKLPYGPGTQVAGPGAPTGGPAGSAAPSTAPDATAPPAATPAAPSEQTFEQFRAQNQIDPASLMPDLAGAKAAQAAAAQQLSLARAGRGGDPNKSLSDYNTATDAVNKLQQEANAKVLDAQRQLYDAAQQRQAQAKLKADELAQAAKLKADELAQTAAENEKNRQATQQLEQTKAGQTFHQKLEEQSAQYAQDNTIKPMAAQATKAHQMNLGLSQLLPVLQDLPKGGGALGSVLDAHPDLAPLFNTAGILTDRSADAVRLVNGLVSNISTEMKPTGLGALREYEWDAFKAQLPSLLSTPGGQQKAVAMLMNMNNRIQEEGNWMNKYFTRRVPDETTPGATRPAHNLETEGALSAQQQMDKELGPVIPSYTGPMSGAGQAQWEQALPPGKPYYKTWAVPDPKNPGQPLRDQSGNVRTTKTLEVRPWQ
jgi:hypothetical protein